MDLSNLKDLKLALKLSGVSAKKSLGQNFLVDREALEKIVAAAEIRADETVLEIGPGLGTLTNELVQYARRVIAVEADQELANLLAKRDDSNLQVVAADALQFNVSTLPIGFKVVANLPYYITSALLRFLLEAPNKPTSITVLVQKEVAERIVAAPGNMSILSCSIQYYGEPRIMGVVPAASFHPAPKVDSAILHIMVRPKPLFEADARQLFRLIKAGFGEKRKMLRNSLAGGLGMSSQDVVALLAKGGIPPTARAQELSLDDWHTLYDAWLYR